MRYSKIGKDYFDEDDDEITDKIPIEAFHQINNAPLIFDDPISLIRIIILKSKPEYINYFGNCIYAIYVKSENEDAWFGPPVKNPTIGLMKWERKKWDKIYGFTLNLMFQEDV